MIDNYFRLNMKQLYILIASAALLASCSVNVGDDPIKNPKSGNPEAVNFSIYVNKSASTKAGLTGELTTDRLKEADGGFGVFAYYGNGALYNETSKPDFMYNQKVEYKTVGTTNTWTYEPVKYWPNEYGEEASSEAVDRLTFFAYAPHVAVTPSTGLVTGDATSGIIGLTRNIAAGDPMVMYEANLVPGNGVDLCWGVAADDFTSSVNGGQNHVEKGAPFLNVIKPKTGDRIAFDFNHALAQLNVQVDADIDVESHGGDELVNDGTRVYVRSVTFNGFALRGSLNLNSNKTNGPAWFDISGTGRVKRDPVTIYDGRTDGIEGMSTALDPNETPAGLNAGIIQSQPYNPAILDGVKHQPVNLFASSTASAPIMVVPVTGVPLSVTIVYDIETADPKLSGYLSDGVTHGVSIENVISKSLPELILSAGKCYALNLHLGLTSVKLDAEVKSWVNTDPTNTDLPDNATVIGTLELTRGGNPLTSVTLWKNQTSLPAPDVTVKDTDGNPITDYSVAWESDDTSVATVSSNGAVTLSGVSGTAKITGTATRQATSGSTKASYTVYVNEVTGISITPASAFVAPTGTVSLAATLTHTNLGTVSVLPTVSWVSGSTNFVSVSPTSGNATVATGVADGSSEVTASVDPACVADGVSASTSATVNCCSSLNTAFRGYWISPGLLYRDNTGNYGLTNLRDGNSFNPFESIGYYDQTSSYDVNTGQYTYYFNWNFLKGADELGADGNNLKADSSKLPSGWMIPSSNIWDIILKDEPKSPILVNGKQLHGTQYTYTHQPIDYNAGAYAFARIDAGNSTYYNGLLLFRDGSTITCSHLNADKVGTKATYANNTLTMDDYNELVSKGCLFFPATGYYSTDFGWRDRSEGFFYDSNVYSPEGLQPCFARFREDPSGDIGGGFHSTSNNNYYSIRLVKVANEPL